MEIINGYRIKQPFGTAGSGTASWTIAVKDGKEYFLKRFNSPKYVPSCMDYCVRYEERKNALYNKIRELDNGNLVVIEDFFHCDTFYYIATQCIHESSITADAVHTLEWEKRIIIMKTLVHCMVQMEKGGIVHADLKPTNVMLKPTISGYYSLKLIDFDSSFFVASPPENREELEGDMTYLSPEVLMAMCGEDIELTGKIDVFAVGIMFHQFLTGELPAFNRSEYDSICEAVANRAEIGIEESIPEHLRHLIRSMLSFKPEDRPTFSEVFNRLSNAPSTACETSRPASELISKTISIEKRAEESKNPWLRTAGDL